MTNVETAPLPVDPNYFNFQTPAEFAPIQKGTGNYLPDDLFLFKYRYDDLNSYEKMEFDKITEDIGKEDINNLEKLKKVNEVLEKFFIDNNIVNVYTQEQIPQLRKIDKLNFKEAQDYFAKNLGDEEKIAIEMKMKNDMEYAKKYYKENEIPTENELLIETIKEYQLSKLKDEMALSDMTKAQEEALLGMKVPETEIPDEDKFHLGLFDDSDDGEDMPSPSHTAISKASTRPLASSSIGEISNVEEAKRKPMPKRAVGRPATRAETIAKKEYENEVKNFKLTKKVNAGKTFDFNQPQRIEYNIEFYNSFNY